MSLVSADVGGMDTYADVHAEAAVEAMATMPSVPKVAMAICADSGGVG